MIYTSLGWTSYFQLGNSNSLSSIDISAGFVGLDFYFAPLHGLLMLVHLYAGPVFWFLSFLRGCRHGRSKEKWQLCNAFLLIRFFMLMVSFFSCTLQRHHLFVWTVFAPKIFYEASHTVVLCVLTLVCILY